MILLKHNTNAAVMSERVMAFSNNCNCNKHCYAAMNRLKDKLPRYTLTSVFTNQQAFLPIIINRLKGNADDFIK